MLVISTLAVFNVPFTLKSTSSNKAYIGPVGKLVSDSWESSVNDTAPVFPPWMEFHSVHLTSFHSSRIHRNRYRIDRRCRLCSLDYFLHPSPRLQPLPTSCSLRLFLVLHSCLIRTVYCLLDYYSLLPAVYCFLINIPLVVLSIVLFVISGVFIGKARSDTFIPYSAVVILFAIILADEPSR